MALRTERSSLSVCVMLGAAAASSMGSHPALHHGPRRPLLELGAGRLESVGFLRRRAEGLDRGLTHADRARQLVATFIDDPQSLVGVDGGEPRRHVLLVQLDRRVDLSFGLELHPAGAASAAQLGQLGWSDAELAGMCRWDGAVMVPESSTTRAGIGAQCLLRGRIA